jgi:hypothetical protein
MRTKLSITAALLVVVATAAASAPARAGDGPATDDALERSAQLYRKARALQMDAKWAEAEAAYQAAWDIRKSFDIAGNLGDCELHVGQPREAAEHLAYSLAHTPAGATPQQKDALNQRLQEARRQVGTLHVRTSPSGAAVLIDGRPVEDLPNGLVFVDPGARTVEARLQGYGTARKTIDAPAGSEQDVALTLSAVVTPPPTSTAPTPPPPGPNKILLVTGGVTAGAAIVTGAALLGVAAAKGSTVSSLQTQIQQDGGCASATGGGNCADLRSTASSKRTLGNAGLWTLVAGGGVGVATLVYGLVGGAKAPPPKSGWRVSPAPAPGGGGLVVQGTF